MSGQEINRGLYGMLRQAHRLICLNRSCFQRRSGRNVKRLSAACNYHSVAGVKYNSFSDSKVSDRLKSHVSGSYLSASPLRHHWTYDEIRAISNTDISRNYCTKGQTPLNVDLYMDCCDEGTRRQLQESMLISFNFITEEEELQLMSEIEPHLKRLRYETSHWDDAIHGYRETERKSWTEKNKAIIQRVRDVAFSPGTAQLAYVHVLDLKKDGYIKPHVDAVKFCGNTVAGICLLSPAIMRLVHNENKTKFADFLLERRCLYIMKDTARYDFTHEILKEEESIFKGKKINKDRRISIICRNEPAHDS